MFNDTLDNLFITLQIFIISQASKQLTPKSCSKYQIVCLDMPIVDSYLYFLPFGSYIIKKIKSFFFFFTFLKEGKEKEKDKQKSIFTNDRIKSSLLHRLRKEIKKKKCKNPHFKRAPNIFSQVQHHESKVRSFI